MAVLDPFYGLHPAGAAVSRWLNRLLIASECCIAWMFLSGLSDRGCPLWALVVLGALFPVLAGFVNGVIRLFWNLVLVLFYGTSSVPVRQKKEKEPSLPAFRWADGGRAAAGENVRRGRAALHSL